MINRKINGKIQEKIKKDKRKKRSVLGATKKKLNNKIVQKFNSFVDCCSMKKKTEIFELYVHEKLIGLVSF